MVFRSPRSSRSLALVLLIASTHSQRDLWAGKMPYRDVKAPRQHEPPTSLWLRSLPNLSRHNKALQWCSHYADRVPPIWDTGHPGIELRKLLASGASSELAENGGKKGRALVRGAGTAGAAGAAACGRPAADPPGLSHMCR